MYKKELRSILKGRNPKISHEDFGRVTVATLDSSQGDEANIVIVDLCLTDRIGLTGDIKRICLMLTRAKEFLP